MHITRKVREMTPTRYTMHEAAKLAGVSISTIKRWKKNDLFVPSETRQFGSITVDLYRPEDIPILVEIKKTNHPGRKPNAHPETDSPEASAD